MVGLSNEFALVAACCRWPRDAASDALVVASAAAVEDWPRFARIVRRQRVEGLVHHTLRRCGVPVPDKLAKDIGADARIIAQQNLMFAAESARLRDLFADADIPLIFIKGLTLAVLAYGNLGLKRGWDIDIAVPPDRAEAAAALLTAAGYVRTIPDPALSDAQFRIWVRHWKESVWRHRDKGIYVELHTGLVDNPRLLPGLGALSPVQQVEIAPGLALPTLKKEELFAYLCVHGASSAWVRIKWLADVGALLGAGDSAETERLYRRSRELGAGRASAQALLLCAELFETPLPSTLAAELRADRANRYLAHAALAMMAGANEEREADDRLLGTLPTHLTQFLLLKGWRYKLSELRRQARSPYDRATLALPRPLHFLYPLLLLPRWLIRRAGRNA